MSESPQRGRQRRGLAVAVLLIGLTATAFGVWREHEIARRDQIIRWQEGMGRLRPFFESLLGRKFETLNDQAKAILRRQNFSDSSWDSFLNDSEWQQRFPGMEEIGYAEFEDGKCAVKHIASRQRSSAHGPGFDLNSNSVIREGLSKTAEAGYGIASRTLQLGEQSNSVPVVVAFLPMRIKDMRPGTPAENRANLRGVVFFVLNQLEYFRSVKAELKSLPFEIRLLGPDEASPPRTSVQRAFSNTTTSGEWRFLATMHESPSSAPQWIVLVFGSTLSLLLFWLFATQARLRFETEMANQKILARDAEITTLNRDLEQKIAARTEELNVALAEEKELNRLKSNFISMVTHEIRTPLSIILGASEILERYFDRLPAEKRSEHLKTIDSSVQRMAALLEDVLLFSKAEAGRIEFNPVQFDLKDFCGQVTDELLSATNRRCPIELVVEETNGPARADTDLLRHIFSNLITNAVKYSQPGAPVKWSVSRQEGDAVFIVQDRGMGIPEEDRKRLFTPFYRGKNAAHIVGTGLGLVIVRHCVERHGGSIAIESAPGRGTTVRVRLPLFSPAHTAFIKRISQP